MIERPIPQIPPAAVTIPELAWQEGPFSELFHQAAELVGRRWTGAILFGLAHGLTRFSELRVAIPGLSARLLSGRLRDLEQSGIIRRVAQPESKRRAYQLTEKGDALRPVLIALNHWAVSWTKADPPPQRQPRRSSTP